MQGSIGVDIQAFCQKFYEYGGLIWLLNHAGLSLPIGTLLTAVLLLITNLAECWVPGRSAEITNAIMALALGVVFATLPEAKRQKAALPHHLRRGLRARLQGQHRRAKSCTTWRAPLASSRGSRGRCCPGCSGQPSQAPSAHRSRLLFSPPYEFTKADGQRDEIPNLWLECDVDKGPGGQKRHHPCL